jgi:filamin
VTYEGTKVPNSPFTVGVAPGCDPSRVKVYGPGIEGGQPNQPSKFTINTRGAGQGGIGLSVVGPTEPRVGCEDNQDGTLAVEYFPDSPGEYEIGVTFNEQNVPGSPFRVNIQESSPFYPDKVKCFGPGLNPRGVRKGEKAVFSVVTNQAGIANLEVFTTDVRTGQRKPAQIKQLPSGSYDVEYTPEAEGPVKIDVLYGGQHVPNSPFTTESQVGQDITKVALSGDGIKPHVPATVPVTFTVDTKQAGPAPVEVEIKTPQGKTVAPNISATPEGTYTVSYTPEELGAYTIIVKYAGQVLPSGPIHISAVPSGNAEKVIVPGNIRPVLAVGETCSFTIQKSQAGIGRATCRVTKVSSTTATATVTEVKTEVIENGDGTVTIKYTVLEEGVYAVDLKFGGAPVPNGHFTQKVGQVVEETIQAVQTASTESAVFQQQEAVIQAQQAASTEAAPTPSSEYRPVELPTISIGPNINLVSAVITKPSGQKHVPKILDNGNGSIKVVHHPTETGPHTLDVTYDSVPVPGSPFNFYVHSTKPGQASAFGPGLIGGKVGQPASFTVVTKDAGPGGLGLSIEGPSKAEIQCKDNKDGTATITYTPVTPGEYKIIIKFAGQMIPGGPFTAKISGGETVIGQSQLSSSSQINQSTQQSTSRESHVTTGSTTTHQMSVTITETDLSSLTATIRSPSGHEEPCGLKRQPNGQLGISFTPREVGEHWVNVFRNGQPIPGSPFKIIINQSEVGNASRVQVIGTGIQHGVANEVNEFTINTKEAGVAGLSISVQGPGKVDIKCTENPDGTTRVTYKPTEPGNYNMTIKYGEQNIPGSPFTINVGGVSSGRVKESIVRQQQAATISSVGTTCELNITMAGINVQEIEGTVTSPSGATDKCEVVDLGNNRFTIKFFPKEMGIHTVSLKHKGLHIPGSPFQFTVGPIVGGGPEKVRAIGSGLERGEANKPCAFTVITREAGAGGLSMGIEGPSKAVIDFQDRRDGTSDVTYTCSEPGEYLVSVKFNGQHIPDSPFKVYMLPSGGDSKKLNIQNLQQHGLQVNTQTQFLVDFNGAQGKLNAKVVSPSGTESEAVVQEVQNGRFSVNFVPRESGVHYVHITLNGNHVPGSPYPVQVGGVEADAGRVRAYGAGLSTGQSGKECKFIVNTVNAGSGALNVGISGPSKAELRGREVDEGYEFSYTPMAPGDYLITIKYAGNSHIPGSPFKAHIEGIGTPTAWSESSRVTMQTVKRTTTTTTSQQQQVQQQVQQQQQSLPAVEEKAPDATKVVALGNGLLQCQINQEATFVVHGGDAGFNMLLVGIAGPRIPCEKILIEHQGNLKYTVKYQLSQPGNYTLVVKWGDQHIPGSPYNIVAK